MAKESSVLNVKGMSCNHCVNSIKNALGSIKGIHQVEVDLRTNRVTVEYDSDLVAIQLITETIEDQGYEVK